MSRPLRLQFPGALFHVTSRGNERRPTFLDDYDRRRFLELLGEAVRRFGWIVTTYVLMSNHFHLVVQLTERTLSRGMKWLNGTYTQWFNARHDRVGHLLQGRFHSPLVDKQTYFLELQRYVVLNPVRARMVAQPEDYEWSSYRALTGRADAPDWLAVDDALIQFGRDRDSARIQYEHFVAEGIKSPRCIWDDLVGGAYLGPPSWVEEVKERIELKPRSNEHPFLQREVARLDMTTVIRAVATVLDVPEDRIREGHGGTPRSLAAWIGCYEAKLFNGEIAAALRLRSEARVTNLVAQMERELRNDSILRECVDRCVATLGRKN